MIQKKICMLGERAVGKTSLVARFVRGIFSEKYLSTIGVKVDRKSVVLDETTVNLILWDIEGESQFRRVRDSYLKGSSGFFLVSDGTRRETVESALEISERLSSEYPGLPQLLAINKYDLEEDWEVTPKRIAYYRERGLQIELTSARSGVAVENAFTWLAKQTISPGE